MSDISDTQPLLYKRRLGVFIGTYCRKVILRYTCGIPRTGRWLLLALFVVAGSASLAAAQDGVWPPYPLPDRATNFKDVRGPGGYISLFKVVLFLVPFFLWVKTTDWANQDCQQLRLDYGKWNPIVAGPFFAAILIAWLLPWFWLGYLLMWLAFAG